MRHHVCFIVPPHVLKNLTKHSDPEVRERAHHTMDVAAQARGARALVQSLGFIASPSPGTKRRTVYDAKNGSKLPGKFVRGEGDKPVSDTSANEAYDYAGDTYDFYQKVYGRNSVDDKGMRLDSTVHYQVKFDNAFWNGTQMVYGDGDNVIFIHFTGSIDVIGHELTHGVTQFTSALEYQDQPGALNEHFSDVMGSLVKQWKKNQTAAQADWLIGEGILAPGVKGVALRSMKAPGTAYNDPKTLGKDPQPANMKNFVNTSQDNGGVHINSGIPNKAFYNAAIAIGGYAWEKAGRIWYTAFTKRVEQTSQFADAAQATLDAAADLYGPGSAEQLAVAAAWNAVGVPATPKTIIAAGGAKIQVKAPALPAPAPAPAEIVHPRKKARLPRAK
jgi:Zn-dependent metalloprotease